MKLFQLATLTLLLTTPFISQGKLIMNNNTAEVIDVWKDAHGKEYPIYRNPQPKEKFHFTVRLFDAPKELTVVKMVVQYKSDCQILVNRSAGAYAKIGKAFPLTFEKGQDGVYRATVYGDYLLDVDMGDTGKQCTWEIEGISVNLEPKPNIAMIRYFAHLNVSKFTLRAPNGWANVAYITRWRFNEKIHSRNEIFTITTGPDKGSFGEQQRKELATVHMQLEKAE